MNHNTSGTNAGSFSQPQSQHLLHEAAATGDVSRVKRLLKKGRFAPDTRDASGQTILHIAAVHGHVRLAEYLFKHTSININAVDKNRWTPLLTACQYSQLYMCEDLLAQRCSVTMRTRDGNTPLHYLVRSPSSDAPRLERLILMLVRAGCDINSKNNLGETPLHSAAARGLPTTIRFLIQQRASVDLANQFGDTPLIFAARAGRHENVKELLQAHASPKPAGPDGNCWQVASAIGNARVLDLLRPHFPDAAAKKESAAKHRSAKNGAPSPRRPVSSSTAAAASPVAAQHAHPSSSASASPSSASSPAALPPPGLVSGHGGAAASYAGQPGHQPPLMQYASAPHMRDMMDPYAGRAGPLPYGMPPPPGVGPAYPGEARGGYPGHPVNPYYSHPLPPGYAPPPHGAHHPYAGYPLGALPPYAHAPPPQHMYPNSIHPQQPRPPLQAHHSQPHLLQQPFQQQPPYPQQPSHPVHDHGADPYQQSQRRSTAPPLQQQQSAPSLHYQPNESAPPTRQSMQPRSQTSAQLLPQHHRYSGGADAERQHRKRLMLERRQRKEERARIRAEREARRQQRELEQLEQMPRQRSTVVITDPSTHSAPLSPRHALPAVAAQPNHHQDTPPPPRNHRVPSPHQELQQLQSQFQPEHSAPTVQQPATLPAVVRLQSTVRLQEASSSDDEGSLFFERTVSEEQEVAVAHLDSTSNSHGASDSDSSEDSDSEGTEKSAYTAIYEHSSYAQDDSDPDGASAVDPASLTVVRHRGSYDQQQQQSQQGHHQYHYPQPDSAAPPGAERLQRNLTVELSPHAVHRSPHPPPETSAATGSIRCSTVVSSDDESESETASQRTDLESSAVGSTEPPQDELGRLLHQVNELTTWLTQELQRGNRRTAIKFVSRLRAMIEPLLNRHLYDPRAKETILRVHEALSRYDREVDGAVENLGLDVYLKRMQRGPRTTGEGDDHHHNDSDESSDKDSSSLDSYTSGESDDDDSLNHGGVFGDTFDMNINNI
mmetsp:Transcript_4196/g.12797  ORF Transcript_4196/g.12797 Transcript_4196/m.12797 type:complete len:1001 (-) Transcript_4196:35-3037(-)